MPKTVVTLSSIPPRFGELAPTLLSLLRQRQQADEIRLYVPKAYRRFPEWQGALPQVPYGVTIHRCEVDYGPASKVLPAIKQLRGQDVDLILCDDDKVYDPAWIERFKTQALARPNTCIVEVGETFPDIGDSARSIDRLPRARRLRKNVGYRVRRALTLGLWKPHLYGNSGYVDQISGYGGVLVRPDWFDDAVFDIPDILWTVDDPWLSGHMERAGIPIWLNGQGRTPKPGPGGRINALLDLVEGGHGRVRADLAAIDHFRQHYDIWPKGGRVDTDYARMTRSMVMLALRRLAELHKTR